jgi:hypothetical protein
MRGSLLRLLLISALITILVALASCIPITKPNGQPDPCGDPDCEVTELILNTGYNQATGTLYQPVQLDAYWELVNAPNVGLTVPHSAWVINPNPAWDTLPDSQWISAYDHPALNENNPAPDEPYSLERCFCTCEKTKIIIDLTMLVDNAAWVYFNDELIDELPSPLISNFQLPSFHITHEANIPAGVHCIRVDIRNLTGVAMGLNINGTVTSVPEGALFLKDDCCNPTGDITGRKTDADTGSGLAGWTIVATNTETGETFTTTTDNNGWYYFNDLPPGEYTVSEVAQSGWSQTIPQSGTYTETLEVGQVLQLDFGNSEQEQVCAIITAEEIECGEPGAAGPTYIYTFNVTNVSEMTAYYMLLTPSGGNLTIMPDSPIPLDPPLIDGDTTTVTATLIGAQPGDCLTLTLIDFDPLSPADGYCMDDYCCCPVEVCLPELPDCGSSCVEFYDKEIKLVPSLPGTWAFEYTFCLDNLTPYTVNHIYLYLPDGVTMQSPPMTLPNYIPVSISPGDAFCGIVIITTTMPVAQLQFGISLHDETLDDCCVASHIINLPH